MALSFPAVADWIIAPPPSGDIIQSLRFRFTPANRPVILFEAMLAVVDHIRPASDWVISAEQSRSFVARAFETGRSKWDSVIDPDLELAYDAAGTEFKFEIAGKFERVVNYLEVGGVPSIEFKAADATAQIQIESWMVWLNGIEKLIQLNE